MRIYIMRHGDAEDPSRRSSDEERQLTSQGKAEVDQVARAAKKSKVAPDLVMSSPYTRAVETAQLACAAFGYSGDVARTAALVPSGEPHEVWEEIRAHNGLERVLVVGHEPLLSRTVAFLLGTPALQVKMTTGALVCVEMIDFGKQPHGVLKWMLTPKVARA